MGQHEGDPSGADLEDYIYRKFEREVPDDCRELKIYTGFRDYDFNQRRRLTFLDSDLSQLLDKTRLTSLETIIFHVVALITLLILNGLMNYQHLEMFTLIFLRKK